MISLIVPFYNEEDQIRKTYLALSGELKRYQAYELIFVNDGSYDGSYEILSKLLLLFTSVTLSLTMESIYLIGLL